MLLTGTAHRGARRQGDPMRVTGNVDLLDDLPEGFLRVPEASHPFGNFWRRYRQRYPLKYTLPMPPSLA